MSSQSPDSDDTAHDEDDAPPASPSPDKPDIEPMSLPSTYRAFRESIVGIGTVGRLLWDTIRIVTGVVFILGLLLFLTGTTTPLVSVMSGSMEPNINTGDMLVTTKYQPENPPPLAEHGEIITVEESQEQPGTHTSFGKEGDVIVFEPTNGGTPILHRAHFWVEENENWVSRADPALLGDAESCAEIHHCPAPNSGFITHGDHNEVYDQVKVEERPVSREQVIAVGQYRIPYIGWIPNGIEVITP